MLGEDALILHLAELLWCRYRHSSLRQKAAVTLVDIHNLLTIDCFTYCKHKGRL